MDISNIDQNTGAYFGPGWELLNHVNQVYQVRELVLGILHTESPNLPKAANMVCRKIAKRMSTEHETDRHITASEVETLQQLLGTIQFPNVPHHGGVVKDGQNAVSTLLNAVYGANSVNGKTVVDVVAFGPMNKAQLFRQSCTALLKYCIDPSNCFTLMKLGKAVDCDELVEESLLFGLSNFGVCYQSNKDGFCQLEEQSLFRLLQNRHLQMSSQDEVVDAILSWVGSDGDTRKYLLATLLETFANLESLDVSSLAALSTHPLVTDDVACLKTITDAYMQKCMTASDKPKPGQKPSGYQQQGDGVPSLYAPCRTC